MDSRTEQTTSLLSLNYFPLKSNEIIDFAKCNASLEYIESAIQMGQFNRFANIQNELTSDSDKDLILKLEEKTNEADCFSKTWYCWAPLLSGSLCQRHDSNSRCRIHGSVVKRDKLTGRPIHQEDREMLRAESVSLQLNREKELEENKKSRSRKRYPNLVNLRRKIPTLRTRWKLKNSNQ